MKRHLAEKYFPRYPTKRAVLLPALHHVQHAYNWIPPQAMEEIAAFLEICAGGGDGHGDVLRGVLAQAQGQVSRSGLPLALVRDLSARAI